MPSITPAAAAAPVVPTASARTATHRVLDDVDLLSSILRYLEPPTIAAVVCVDRLRFGVAVDVLYWFVDLEGVTESPLFDITSPRSKIYRAAVRFAHLGGAKGVTFANASALRKMLPRLRRIVSGYADEPQPDCYASAVIFGPHGERDVLHVMHVMPELPCQYRAIYAQLHDWPGFNVEIKLILHVGVLLDMFDDLHEPMYAWLAGLDTARVQVLSVSASYSIAAITCLHRLAAIGFKPLPSLSVDTGCMPDVAALLEGIPRGVPMVTMHSHLHIVDLPDLVAAVRARSSEKMVAQVTIFELHDPLRSWRPTWTSNGVSCASGTVLNLFFPDKRKTRRGKTQSVTGWLRRYAVLFACAWAALGDPSNVELHVEYADEQVVPSPLPVAATVARLAKAISALGCNYIEQHLGGWMGSDSPRLLAQDPAALLGLLESKVRLAQTGA